MKRLAILGSTGSIGESTMRVIRDNPGRFTVATLAAGSNVESLVAQVEACRPELVSLRDRDAADELRRRVGKACEVVHGPDGLVAAATHDGVDLVVGGVVGAAGLPPTRAALSLGRDVALANKETLVVAGQQMTALSRETGAKLLPVDSEHNALHQCLRGETLQEVRRLWLTASGGPFREWSRERLEQVTPAEALRHPTWEMGPKITVDSATLMNKGLEVIEARWLFDVPAERIGVVVHPKSVVHSMVEFVDGSFKAQLGVTDMHHPIQYALSWPERWDTTLPEFDPVAAGPLEFEHPDLDRFPCLGLAFRALERGGAAPAALNAANEVAVQAFLDGALAFTAIPIALGEVVDRVMDGAAGRDGGTLEGLMAADAEARRVAETIVKRGVRR